MRSTLIISNSVQNLAVLHCKVLAEHYTMRAIRKAKSDWIFKQLGRVNDGICGASGSKAAWTAIKTLKRGLGPSKRPPPARMKLPDGTFASTAEENAEVFAQHFEKLYNSVESNYDKTIYFQTFH